ncbi:hypothetical protein PENSPDRAFT_748305 [Peniophora sp. CONT]|nr:hypothetical protein PENSPDRAFT_748305 [Peniophora sp. CONT]
MPIDILVAANATLPVSRLMLPELFSEIIHFALNSDPPRIMSDYMRHLGIAVKASHVCYTWRMLSIGTSSLWARHVGSLPNATAIFLTRSGRALLSIDYEYWSHTASWPSIPIIDSSRLYSLRWRVMEDPDDSAPALRELLSGELYNLDSLYVQATYLYRDGQDTFHTLKAPRLTYLHLGRMFIPFTAPQLRRMELHGVDLSLDKLLALLRTTVFLEFLEINGCDLIPDSEEEDDPEALDARCGEPIKLCHLLNIHLDDDYPRGWYILLSHLRVDLKELVVFAGERFDPSLLAVCLCLTSRMCPPLHVQLESYWNSWCELQPCLPYLPPKRTTLPNMSLGYIEDTLYATDPWIRARDLQLHGLRHITVLELTLYAGWSMDEDEVRAMLCAMPNVSTYWIVDSQTMGGEVEDSSVACTSLVRALVPARTWVDGLTRPEHSQDPLPCPHLRILGIDVSDPRRKELGLDETCHALADRLMGGLPILDTLSFTKITRPLFEDTRALQLASLAQNVYWEDSVGDLVLTFDSV